MSISTDAKEIAFHFIKATTGDTRATKSIISKTIIQAKSILSSGYTKEEIIKVIDYIIEIKKIHMYSLGYVSSAINDVLNEIKKEEEKELIKQQIEQARKEMASIKIETEKVEDDSKQRNQQKSNRFGVQSGFRKKFNLDMFKGNGQDN